MARSGARTAETYLGTLCRRAHDEHGVGKSVRYRSTDACVQCQIFVHRERRQGRYLVKVKRGRGSREELIHRMERQTIAERLITASAIACQVSPANIYRRCRGQRVADARAIVAWLYCRAYGLSYSHAGRCLARDHSTIIHAVGRVDHDVASGGPLRARLSDTIEIMLEHSRRVLAALQPEPGYPVAGADDRPRSDDGAPA